MVQGVYWKYIDVVLARFTVRSILCEMATGDRSRVAQISHLLFCKIIKVAQIPNLWYCNISQFDTEPPEYLVLHVPHYKHHKCSARW